MLMIGSTTLGFFGCSQNEETGVEQTLEEVLLPTPPQGPDLTEALSKRIEGKPAEAIELLRELNEQFPKSPEVLVQLGRSLIDCLLYTSDAADE